MSLAVLAAALANLPLGRLSPASIVLIQGALPWLLLWCAALVLLRSHGANIGLERPELSAAAVCVVGLGLAWWGALLLWTVGKDAQGVAAELIAIRLRASSGGGSFSELLLWDVLSPLASPIPGTAPMFSLRSYHGLWAATNLLGSRAGAAASIMLVSLVQTIVQN